MIAVETREPLSKMLLATARIVMALRRLTAQFCKYSIVIGQTVKQKEANRTEAIKQQMNGGTQIAKSNMRMSSDNLDLAFG